MISISNLETKDFDSIPIDPFWNTGDEQELGMHRIHSYPAKFPAFITTKALEFAKAQKIEVKKISDIFCGCGTVALEAKRNGLAFWGCDINPVATMIAKTKSRNYKGERLIFLSKEILENYFDQVPDSFESANERLQYWFYPEQFHDLSRLKKSILRTIPAKSFYRQFFICAFSNILKSTSKWLTKSIKPQLDPFKKPANVLGAFKNQCKFMIKANEKVDTFSGAKAEIVTGSILNGKMKKPKVDLIVTSPPYVISYEYADLHQLSSLWLGYAEDYRDLREGAIGSLHHVFNFREAFDKLNGVGNKIVSDLLRREKSKARAAAKYFLDMQEVAKESFKMLVDGGMATFVIGNTQYKGVKIDNAKHLAISLKDAGFKDILVSKRKISKKNLTPYRDKKGRFTQDKRGRKVYHEEFIIIGKK